MDPDQRRLIMGQYQRSNTFDTASIPTKMLSTAGRRVLAEYEALHGPTPPIYGPKGMARRLALEGFENGHGRAAEQEVVAIQFKTEKILSTCTYMLSLFTNGSYSDVCIEFVASHFKANKIMKLHKHILCQSAYFQALLNSSWIDANQDIIKITITDKNITEKSVNSLLESFYTSNLKYDTSVEDLISLTATARMFDVDSIAKLCILELSNSISIKNAIYAYHCFTSYATLNEDDGVLNYILRSFSYWYHELPESFKENVLKILDQPLLEMLLTHKDFVVKDEYTLYCIVKEWTIENLTNREDYNYSGFNQQPNSTSFLSTADGEPYVNLFKKIRLSSAMLDKKNLDALKNDNIIPLEWIEEAGAVALSQMMTVSTGCDASVLTHNPADYFRVGIFHSEKDIVFLDQPVNFYGIHLQFRWDAGTLSVGRYRFGDEKMFCHGVCKLQFRLTFYCRKRYISSESCEKVVVVKRFINEYETHSLFGDEPDVRNDPLIYSFSLIRRQMYPTRIGIEIKYLGGIQNFY